MVPRGTSFAPVIGGGITGMAQKNAYGFVRVFAQYQDPFADQHGPAVTDTPP